MPYLVLLVLSPALCVSVPVFDVPFELSTSEFVFGALSCGFLDGFFLCPWKTTEQHSNQLGIPSLQTSSIKPADYLPLWISCSIALSYSNPALSSSNKLYLLDSSSTILFSTYFFICTAFRLCKFLLMLFQVTLSFAGKLSYELCLCPFRFCWIPTCTIYGRLGFKEARYTSSLFK